MLIVKATTLSDAWEKSLQAVYEKGVDQGDQEIFRADLLVLEIEDPCSEKRFHPLFPITTQALIAYNEHALKGTQDDLVRPEHRLYHERFFAYPDKANNQIQALVDRLKKQPQSKRGLVSLWHPDRDQLAEKVPSVLSIWCRIEKGKLNMHAHLRANDAYKKLLMNLNLHATLMKHIADQLGVDVGTYTHIVDSFHIYHPDTKDVEKVLATIKEGNGSNV